MFKLVEENNYQGQSYKIVTKKDKPMPGYGFRSRIEINGVNQGICLPTKASAFEAHQEGLHRVRQLIENQQTCEKSYKLATDFSPII